MEINLKIDGVPIVLKSIKNLRDKCVDIENVSDEFRAGVIYAFDAIIETLENLEDSSV